MICEVMNGYKFVNKGNLILTTDLIRNITAKLLFIQKINSVMFKTIKEWDTEFFLYLNSKHNNFFDVVMYWASDKLFWIPFYLVLFIIIIRYFKKGSILILIHIAALIAASDQIASNLIKNNVKRLRPSHEAALQGLIHLSKAGAGGEYGFISSHASNAFALSVFLSFILPINFRPLKYILFFWALLVSYSRIYNGVHYPSDVLVGIVCGSLLGWIFSRLYFLTLSKIATRQKVSGKQ